MKQGILFSLFTALLFVVPNSYGGQKVDQLLAVDAHGKVFIDITRGLVKVKGWDRAEIQLKGELDDNVNELVLIEKNGKSLLKAVSGHQAHKGDSSVLKVFIPKNAKLFFKGIDTSFSLQNLSGGIEGKTISGDLMSETLKGEVKLSTTSGDIHVAKSSGDFSLESVSGSIETNGNFEQLSIRTMSGDLRLHLNSINELRAKTVSGDVTLKGEQPQKSSVEVATVSGDITYVAHNDLNAQCTAVSQFGGEIENNLTADKVLKGKMHGSALSFTAGKGIAELKLKTLSGNIRLKKGEQ